MILSPYFKELGTPQFQGSCEKKENLILEGFDSNYFENHTKLL